MYIYPSIKLLFLIIVMIVMMTAIVKPINVKEYDFKQSKYDAAPRLPFSQIITGRVVQEKAFYYNQ